MNPLIAIPVTIFLVYRALSRNSLTPLVVVAAVLTAISHAIHPWSVFFTLLVVFFLAGTFVTKVKHEVKSRLTHSSSGSPGGEGPRNHVQVFANSIVASILIIMHAWRLDETGAKESCFSKAVLDKGDLLVYGIVGNYVAVAADTFSSELGILSSSNPKLIIAPWRTVPRGTNGGVTLTGLLAGLLGAFVISAVATLMIPFCESQIKPDLLQDITWTKQSELIFLLSFTLLGLAGSVLDSVLGALFQASVVDVRTGKVVEGEGGGKVPVQGFQHEYRHKEKNASRKIAVGRDILSNNAVNFAMAATISVVAMVIRGWNMDAEINSKFYSQ